jgi:1,4-alpha-glucan branching enzyme
VVKVKKEGKMPTTKFVWKSGEEEITNVLISGTFNQWSEKLELHKNEEGNWEIEIEIPPSVIQFKFIIDGEYECSNDYPTIITWDGFQNNTIEIKSKCKLLNFNLFQQHFQLFYTM